MSTHVYRSFEEFWPFYVREHSKKLTRLLHFGGTSTALGIVAAALIMRKPAWILAAPIAGYSASWIGHFFVEKNRPATFKYPRWSLMGDFKMMAMMIAGTMDAEVERCLAMVSEQPAAANQNGAHHAEVAQRGVVAQSMN